MKTAFTYNEVENRRRFPSDPSLNDVVGTASYEGGAVGVYVIERVRLGR